MEVKECGMGEEYYGKKVGNLGKNNQKPPPGVPSGKKESRRKTGKGQPKKQKNSLKRVVWAWHLARKKLTKKKHQGKKGGGARICD